MGKANHVYSNPIAEIVTGSVGWLLYRRKLKQWNFYDEKQTEINKGDIRMKLITAIINRKDVGEVCTSLTEAGYYFTKMMSSGGFLTSGNTTLIIGTEKDKVKDVMEIIRSHCSKRTEEVATNLQYHIAAYPAQVTVGGATVFVTDVEEFEKM